MWDSGSGPLVHFWVEVCGPASYLRPESWAEVLSVELSVFYSVRNSENHQVLCLQHLYLFSVTV